MKYSIHGPFPIKKKNRLIDRQYVKKEFWAQVENRDALLLSACGCYLFAIRASQGMKPWYVGLAEKQSFKRECFGAQKINHYNDALMSQTKGTPLLFLIARRTKKDGFSRPVSKGHSDIPYLERVLIGVALDKNPDLMNIKKTKLFKEMCVPCLINTPQRYPTQAEKQFKTALLRGRPGGKIRKR